MSSNASQFSGNAVQAAIEALQSGKDVEAAVYGEGSASPQLEDTESSETSFTSQFMDEESTTEVGQEATPVSSKEPSPDSKAPAKAAAGDIEEVVFSDGEGRKKVKVDFSDREKMKKYVEMAFGMRKFQAERDKLKAESSTLRKEHEDLKQTWQALEEAYGKGGLRGLVNLLNGSQDAYDKHIESEYSRRRAKEDASPAELKLIEAEERAQRAEEERVRLQNEQKSFMDNIKREKEKAEEESTRAVVTPAFNKYRFAGKLGDSVLETRLDKAIWTQTMSQLAEYSEDEITPALIDKEFRETAATFRRMVQKQTDQTVKKVIEGKKAAAAESAAAKATSGMRMSNDTESFKDEIRKGNLGSALARMMSGKVKL